MECERIVPRLSAHLDGELDEVEERAVRRHLSGDREAGAGSAGCERCAARLRTLGAAREAMRGARPGPSDRGLDRVWERIRREREGAAPAPVVRLRRPHPPTDLRSDPRSRRRRTTGLAAGLAAAALLAAVLLAPRLEREGADAPETGVPPAVAPALPAASADDVPPACLRPDECGADAPVLFPAVPI